MMAPMLNDHEARTAAGKDKPAIYVIDTFHPKAIEHA